MKIILDNFILKEYDNNNEEQREVIERLNQEDSSKKYLGNLFYSIEKIYSRKKEKFLNTPYIAYYNEEVIGYISLTYFEEEYQISCGILKEYRKQNMASLLLEEFSDYCLEHYSEIEELTLKIKRDNIGSRKVADLVGYEQVDEENFHMKR